MMDFNSTKKDLRLFSKMLHQSLKHLIVLSKIWSTAAIIFKYQKKIPILTSVYLQYHTADAKVFAVFSSIYSTHMIR